MKQLITIIISLFVTSYSFSQNQEKNVMINDDGSFNAYLFVDTLYFDKEAVILSRNDGHLYLLSDSCMLDKLKKTDKIMCMENTYLFEQNLSDFIDYVVTELDLSYLLKLQLDSNDNHFYIDKKTKCYYQMKYKNGEKPRGYYLFFIKGKIYNYLSYERNIVCYDSSVDCSAKPVYFPDENAYYKLAIPFW